MRVRELAEWLGATFEGDGEKELTGVAPIETAGAGDLAFLDSRKAAKQADASAAGCLIVPSGFPNPGGRTVIHTAEPRAAFVRAVSRLHPPAPVEPGIHASAQIDETAEIGPDAVIAPNVVIGAHTKIGARCRVGAGCAIGDRVTLGEDSLLYAHVTLYDDVDIGARAILTDR